MSTLVKQPDSRSTDSALAGGNLAQSPADGEPGLLLLECSRLPPAGEGADPRWAMAAVDLATGWVHAEVAPGRTSVIAREFLTAVRAHASFKVRVVIAERSFVGGADSASGAQSLGEICAELGLEYRSTPAGSAGFSVAAERFLASMTRELERCGPATSEQTLAIVSGCVERHNATTRPGGLSHESPVQALSRWYASRPELFVSAPSYQASQPC